MGCFFLFFFFSKLVVEQYRDWLDLQEEYEPWMIDPPWQTNIPTLKISANIYC